MGCKHKGENMKFLIETEFVSFGVFEGSSESDALNALARDAGYADYAEVQSLHPNTKLIITKLED